MGFNFMKTKVNIVFVLKEVRPETELSLDNHLRCVKSLNTISKYIPNACLTIYLFFVFMYLPMRQKIHQTIKI